MTGIPVVELRLTNWYVEYILQCSLQTHLATHKLKSRNGTQGGS